MAIAKVTGIFTGKSESEPVELIGPFNFTVYGTFKGSVVLERMFDRDGVWHVLHVDASGANPCEYFNPVSIVGEEWERGVKYRARCTGYASGNIHYRISQ